MRELTDQAVFIFNLAKFVVIFESVRATSFVKASEIKV